MTEMVTSPKTLRPHFGMEFDPELSGAHIINKTLCHQRPQTSSYPKCPSHQNYIDCSMSNNPLNASFPTPGLAPSAREFSTEDYFKTQRPPSGLEDKTRIMQAFVDKWSSVHDKKVVLVTVSISCYYELEDPLKGS